MNVENRILRAQAFSYPMLGFLFITTLLFFLFLGYLSKATANDGNQVEDSEPATPSVCLQHLEQRHSKDFIAHEIESFQTLAEEALALRAETIKVGLKLREKAHLELPLSGEEMNLLSKGLAVHLDLRERLMTMAEAHECWLNLSDKELHAAGLNPENKLNGIMLSLAAALVLYDNYLFTVTLFEGDPKLRQLLNDGDRGYEVKKLQLLKVSMSYNSSTRRARVRRAMRYYEKALKKYGCTTNPYLATLIDQSPSYDMVRKWSPLHAFNRKFGVYENILVDSFIGLQNEGVSLFSMLFGNVVGLVETRKGKLYQKKEVYNELKGTLKSGDILLEKTPFRLTDKLIPGYWGHAAVWIGTERELRDLKLWDHPLVQKYHEEIRSGRLIVEALRSGVEMNQLQHFLNIDSIGIVRPESLSDQVRKQIVLKALRQVGKSYDFNFDVESLEKVYCSKLIYLVYPGVEWPVKESFGRTTFTPDDVATSAISYDSLKLISFYHDGHKIKESPNTRLADLMGLTH